MDEGWSSGLALRRHRPRRPRAAGEARRRSTRRGLSVPWLLAAAFAACVSCKDPAREEAERIARDRVLLIEVLSLDAKAEAALKIVGEAERQKKDEEAAGLLESSVMPKADAALALATATQPTTPWGKARRDEMIAVMTDRKAELPRYVTALRAHDWEGQLASVQKQIAIETRAMKAAEAIQGAVAGPSADRR